MPIMERFKTQLAAPGEAKLIASVALIVAVVALGIAIGGLIKNGR